MTLTDSAVDSFFRFTEKDSAADHANFIDSREIALIDAAVNSYWDKRVSA